VSGAIVLVSTGEVLATNIAWARTAWERARGLIARPPLDGGAALVIDPARQVHTFGMSYAIDIVFCDSRWVVRHVVRSMKPGRLTRWVARGRYAIELAQGSVPQDVACGERVILKL
jgi:uncharacterized membrane protein (UPF0127 family)